jgi:hypothetical protein
MADTASQPPPATNGGGVDSDEEDLSKLRPVDIEQVRQEAGF